MNKYGQIYRITNKVNNKVYIGLTIRKNVLHDRYRGSLLSTHNDHLKKSINKYGKENFKIETLCWCNSEEELCNKEIEYIAYYNSTNSENGYNKNEGGVTGNGAIVSDETKILIGKKSKIAWDSTPERRKILLRV